MTPALRLLVSGGLIALGSLPPAGAQTSRPDCSREALRGLVDRYFTALAAHDPSGLPLAPNVRSTENGVELAVGKRLWQTAGKPLLRRVLDGKVERINAVVGPRSASTGWAPVPECLSGG